MKTVTPPLDSIQQWSMLSRPILYWPFIILASLMFLTLAPWAMAYFPVNFAPQICFIATTNICIGIIIIIYMGVMILLKIWNWKYLFDLINIILVIWWINLVPIVSTNGLGQQIGLLIGCFDILIITIILGTRVFKTVFTHAIYQDCILYIIQTLYIAIVCLFYAASLITLTSN